MKTECQGLGGIFIEEYVFFFLWEKVVIVKYKLLFLRTLYFTFLNYFRNSQSSAEGNIYSVTSWGTLTPEWLMLSFGSFLERTVERFSIYFLNFACKWPDHILAILHFLIISNSDFFHCRMFYVKYICVICFKI